jgi:hypothetical protein
MINTTTAVGFTIKPRLKVTVRPSNYSAIHCTGSVRVHETALTVAKTGLTGRVHNPRKLAKYSNTRKVRNGTHVH